jgi:hypothetical protein
MSNNWIYKYQSKNLSSWELMATLDKGIILSLAKW